jgi:hypothetical protein
MDSNPQPCMSINFVFRSVLQLVFLCEAVENLVIHSYNIKIIRKKINSGTGTFQTILISCLCLFNLQHFCCRVVWSEITFANPLLAGSIVELNINSLKLENIILFSTRCIWPVERESSFVPGRGRYTVGSVLLICFFELCFCPSHIFPKLVK